MSTATADFELRPKLEAFERAMRETVPGMSADGAKKAAAAWEQNFYKQQALQASGLTDLHKKTSDDISGAWLAFGRKLSRSVGGPVGQVGSALTGLVPKATAVGVAIGALAGGAVGIAAVAGAVVGLGNAADAAEHRLMKAGLAALIPQEARESISDYDKSTGKLGHAVDALVVTYGSGLLPALTSFADKATTAITVADKLHDTFKGLGDLLYYVAGAASLGTIPAFLKVKEIATEIHDEFLTFIGDSKKVTEWLHSMGISAKEGAGAWLIQAGAIANATDQYGELHQVFTDAENQQMDYDQEQAAVDDDERERQDKLAKVIIEKNKEKAKSAAAAAAAAKRQALEEEQAQIRFGEAVAAGRTKDRDEEAHAAYERTKEIEDEKKADIEADKEQARFAEAVAASREKEKKEAAEAAFAFSQQRKEQKSADLAKLQGITDVMQATQELADLVAQGGGKGARKAFRISQALAESQIVMGTAKSVADALSTPWLIPGIIALGGAEAAKVAAEKPPEMPGGGVVPYDLSNDHRLVPLQPGEGVVSRRGMANIGEDGLRELNGGRGGGGVVVVQNVYRHKIHDTFIKNDLKRGGPLAQALASQRKPGHSVRA